MGILKQWLGPARWTTLERVHLGKQPMALPGVATAAARSFTWPMLEGALACPEADVLVVRRGLDLKRWHKAGIGHGVQRWQAAAFALGLMVAGAALLSPLDAISDALFSAHMAQHELLMLVAAPLFVLGRPWFTALWAMPFGLRARALTWTTSARARSTLRAVTHPLLVLVVHGAVLWLWHVPLLFEAALASEPLHDVQHFTFFASAALFFYALVHGRYGRAGYGMAVVFLFVTALHSGLLGALLTFARDGWYPTHARRTAAFARAALEDQQLAGLIMWIPACSVLMAIGLALFSAWLGEAERRAARVA